MMSFLPGIVFAVILVLQAVPYNSLGLSVNGDIGKGASGLIEGIGGAAKGSVDGLGDLEELIANAKKQKHDSHSSESSEESDESHEHKKHNGDEENHKHGHEKRKGTGRGIDWKTGIGSRDGIRTPINDLLGLSQAVCKISFGAEDLIENLGELHMFADKQVGIIDRAIVDYITDNFILKLVDGVRKYHIGFVGFLVDTHVAFDRFVTNTIVEVYRITKSPVRELFACH